MDVNDGFLAQEQVLFEELHVQRGVSWATLANLLLEEAWAFLFSLTFIVVANQYFIWYAHLDMRPLICNNDQEIIVKEALLVQHVEFDGQCYGIWHGINIIGGYGLWHRNNITQGEFQRLWISCLRTNFGKMQEI